MLYKYQILIVFLFLTGIGFPQISKDQLKNELDNLLKEPFFNSTTIAIDAFDLTNGEYLYRFNERKLLNPASNMKLLTSAAGLIFLGPRYNFITSVQYTGEIINKTLEGDLYVIGGFDPDFTTADLNKFIKDIKKAGIKEIRGNIYGDVSRKDSVVWGRGWMWDDNQSTNAPYLSALNINSNSIDVYVTGTSQGEKANVFTDPQTQYVKVFNNTVTSSVDPQNIKVTRDWHNKNNDIYVNGYILPPEFTSGDTVESSVNIFRPELYFLTLFKERMERSGIKVDGEVSLQKRPLAAKWLSVFSRQYDSVMVYMNKHSDNLSAEMTLYSLAASFNLYPVSARQGIRVIDSLLTLAGVEADDYNIADGSGVSRYSLLSAAQILSVLIYMYTAAPELFLLYYMSLPVAGIDGTLRSRMNNNAATGKVHAKTGTLQGVSCLSGYIISKNKHLIAFSILEQNYVDKTSYARFIQDQICELIAKYE
jgi:D-alanyl-D-alanine carboxypeptidase/D-alanyl-D-alanine-endopeptidase (penicillin-binding protein 4)